MRPLIPEQKNSTSSKRSSQAPLVADGSWTRGRALLGAAMTFPPHAAPGSSDGAPLAVGNGRIIAPPRGSTPAIHQPVAVRPRAVRRGEGGPNGPPSPVPEIVNRSRYGSSGRSCSVSSPSSPGNVTTELTAPSGVPGIIDAGSAPIASGAMALDVVGIAADAGLTGCAAAVVVGAITSAVVGRTGGAPTGMGGETLPLAGALVP